jgi:hypothetical protein
LEDLNDGLRSLEATGVPFSAEAAESAETGESAVSAVAVFRSASRVLSSPEVIVCRLPCRSLLRPLSPAEPDKPVDRLFALPIVSAGSGTAVLDPAWVSSSTFPADAMVAMSAESEEVESPELEEEELPLAPLPRCDAPERELPALVGDDDMMSLSAMVSAASPSGSAVRLGGAMMSGG